jgi:outer membrane receptor protein involved in Fe transport
MSTGRVLAAVGLCVAVGGPALAQPASAVIEGIVRDESGAAVPNATVTAKSVATGWETQVPTAESGAYRLAALPPGQYQVVVELQGFAPVTRDGVTVHVGDAVTVNIVLKVGQREETVTVEVPLVNATKSELGQIVEAKRIEELPLNGRNFLQLASLTPGVAPSTGFGGGQTSVNGFSFRNVSMNIDGLDTTDVVARGTYGFYTSEPVQEFQIITNRFTAEYGRSLSGVINVITKSGSNEFHGTLYDYTRDQRLDGRQWTFNSSTLKLEKQRGEKSKFAQQQYGGSFSGPVIRDKTHFFTNYEVNTNDTTAFVTADPAWSYQGLDISNEVGNFPRGTDGYQVFAKLNHQLSRRHALQGSYTRNHDTNFNLEVGGFQTLKFGATQLFNEDLWMFSDRFTVSNRAINEFHVQIGTRQGDWIPNDRHPSIYQYTTFGVISCCGSHPSVDQTNHTRRLQFKDDFTFHLDRHNLKFGAEYQTLRGDSDTRYSANGYYVLQFSNPTAPPTTLYYIQSFGPTHFIFDVPVYSAYAQNDWRVRNNLTLNLGLRYEHNGFAPADDFAPRAGFAWDPWNDGKTSIRGGTGLFYDLSFTQVLQTQGWGGRDGSYNLTFLPNDAQFPADWGNIPSLAPGKPIPPRNVYELDPNMRTASSWQNSLGIVRQLTPTLVASIDGVYIRGYNLLRLRDANAPPYPETPYPRGQETVFADRLRPLPPATSGLRRIQLLESAARSEYRGLYMSLTRRSTGNMFQLSYTLSKSLDDIPVGGDYTSAANDSTNMGAEWGPSLNDLRHVIASNATVRLPWGFSTGGIFVAYSGRPYTAYLGYDYNGDGVNSDRPQGVGKGTLTGTWFRQFDLFLNKTVRFNNRWHVVLRVEAYNVFDILNETGFGSTVGTATYGVATGARMPRTLQLSARLNF